MASTKRKWPNGIQRNFYRREGERGTLVRESKVPGLSLDGNFFLPHAASGRSLRLETSLYRFNTFSDGQMVIFQKTDRNSEAMMDPVSILC